MIFKKLYKGWNSRKWKHLKKLQNGWFKILKKKKKKKKNPISLDKTYGEAVHTTITKSWIKGLV
jgi:hypothetical protein